MGSKEEEREREKVNEKINEKKLKKENRNGKKIKMGKVKANEKS